MMGALRVLIPKMGSAPLSMGDHNWAEHRFPNVGQGSDRFVG